MSRKSLIELALLLGRETKANVADILWLLRLAKRWNTLVTEECNRELSFKERKTKRNVQHRLSCLAKDIGATGVILSFDPRGCTVKLTVMPRCFCGYQGPNTTCPKCVKPMPRQGFTNDFGNEGICIL